MAGIWVNCEIFENEDYDFCFYAVDQAVVFRDELPLPNPGEVLLIFDNIIPNITKRMKDNPLKKKGILIYSDNKKEEQEL